MDAIFRAWDLSKPLHDLRPPADTDDLELVEEMISRQLPSELVELYRHTNGGELLGGNLQLEPALPHDDRPGLANAAETLRQAHWPIPDSLLVFGSNGAGSVLGIWLPQSPAAHAVIEVGELFKPASMAILGTRLSRFLAGWTAYHLLLTSDQLDPEPALDALALPAELRAPDPDTNHCYALLQWADPDLPNPRPDPYLHGLNATELDRLLTSH